jgi:hypothetical protein
MIDTGIYLHRWPFGRLPGEDPVAFGYRTLSGALDQR